MSKTTNIIYWISTGLLSLSFLYGGYSEIMREQSGLDLMVHLGYPAYLLTILGVAKLLAVIGILQRFSPTLREWAYAGIVIDILGAISSMIAVRDPYMMTLPAVISLVVVAVSYITMRKRTGLPVGF